MKKAASFFICLLMMVAASPAQARLMEKEPEIRSQTGLASYYSNRFHNRRTANGERYHKEKLTAAHRFLPFGTRVRVVNLKNQKSVVVRINDRGPFIRQRIIDLSRRAASRIGLTRRGVGQVRLEVVELGK